MKNKLLFTWIIFHLSFIVISNVQNSYTTYCEFYNKKKNDLPLITNALQLPFARYYGRYTGAETGYGFFGFNVRSNGLFIAECDGRKLTPRFNTNESSLRFFSLSSALTDKLLSDEQANDTVNVLSKYYDLAIKNIAVKLYNENNCTDSSVIISYNLISFPSLVEFRKNKEGSYQLTKLKIMKITL